MLLIIEEYRIFYLIHFDTTHRAGGTKNRIGDLIEHMRIL